MPQLQTADGHKLTVMGTVKAHLQLEQFSGENDDVEEIAIPNFGDEVVYDIPPAPAELRDLVKRFELTIHQCEFHPGEYQLTTGLKLSVN
ncbi:hypothetical protein EMCRGX_G009085 [Ephydatia muelleri]